MFGVYYYPVGSKVGGGEQWEKDSYEICEIVISTWFTENQK